MPPITETLKALLSSRYAKVEDQLGGLGKVFRDSADSNPAYFNSSERIPSTSLSELARRHGLYRVDGDPKDLSFLAEQGGDPISVVRVQNAQGLIDRAHKMGDVGEFKNLTNLINTNKINPGTEMYGIDSMQAGAGTGQAKKIYPAAYEWLLGQPDAANYTASGLSTPNMLGRTRNSVGTMEKFGPRAANRILMDDTQLGPVGGASRIQEYDRLPFEGQVGLLNARIADTSQRQVNGALGQLFKSDAGSRFGEDFVRRNQLRAKALGLDGNGWSPSTDVDPEYFSNLAGWLHGITKVAPGVDSLRRTAITADHLGQGLTAKDLSTQPWLTNKLARKEGGPIPGALSQCACGH